MVVPEPHASRKEWVDYAVSQGLDPDDAEQLTRDELAALFVEEPAEEDVYQDQGSLDQPIQFTEPAEADEGVGTPELRDEARQRTAPSRPKRERFPWEVGPPK